MEQVLNVSVPIQIPDEYELVNKSEYQKLRDGSLTGRTWNMADLKDWLGGKDVKWIKKNILENSRYRKDMLQMESDRTLVFPKGKGSPWKFKANVMADWLDKHWSEFDW